MPRLRLGIAVAVLLAGAGAAALGAQAMGPRQLEVTFKDGTVSIVAQNVTVRDILMEWGRKGGSRMVNVDKLGGAIIPLIEFHDEPEAKVLRSLLRDVPGYGAAPRVAPAANASTFAAVFVLPTRSVAVSNVSSPMSSPVQQVQAPQPQPVPQPIQGSVDAEIPPVRQVGELPPSTPGGNTTNNPNLRTGPGGAVTSTIPGVIIPGSPTTPTGGGTSGPGGTGPRPAGGRGGGGGGR